MSTGTKQINNILAVLKNVFNSEPGEYDAEELPLNLVETLNSLHKEEVEVEKPFNDIKAESSNNGGFAKRINPKTEEAMRRMLSKEGKKPPVNDREERTE